MLWLLWLLLGLVLMLMLMLMLLLERRVDALLCNVLRVRLLLVEIVEVGVAERSVIIGLCERRRAVQRRASIHVGLAVEVVWCI